MSEFYRQEFTWGYPQKHENVHHNIFKMEQKS